jgi:hypothetical protein
MSEVRIDRLSSPFAGPILHGVTGENTMTKFSYPSTQELYALELAARRARAQAVAEALRSGVAAVKSFFSRGAVAAAPKGMRHA